MKTKYLVEKIKWDRQHPENDAEAVKNAERKICCGLKEVFDFCGGKLKRERCGYAGCFGDIGYIATRI